MNWLHRRLNPILAQLERENAAAARVFRSDVAHAAPGHYFRALHAAINASHPYGQPIDFPELARELATLEQRVADVEELVDRIDRRLPFKEFPSGGLAR